MTEEFYYDTSIWLDFHEKRGENGKAALKLVLKIINEDFKMAYSDLTVREFKNLGYTQNEVNAILSIVKPDNIKKVHIYKEQKEEAKRISRQKNIPEGDILHAILCRDNNIQLIARDPHFDQLKEITTAKPPEDFS